MQEYGRRWLMMADEVCLVLQHQLEEHHMLAMKLSIYHQKVAEQEHHTPALLDQHQFKGEEDIQGELRMGHDKNIVNNPNCITTLYSFSILCIKYW
ncbi:hypothetical protein EB796_021668 [Bugula neritina]|uniref:Uncharacterized protein n=1 Tax=Bugula neritina TaxID=10212 RepID=A0A7J7J3K6_BUGNE|nr:hypothetical protein EB796_021668 [Bugula neritina]